MFLFDIKSIGDNALVMGISGILQNETIIKVCNQHYVLLLPKLIKLNSEYYIIYILLF